MTKNSCNLFSAILTVLLSARTSSKYTMIEINSRIPDSQDISTPFDVPLSGVYTRSYAYVSLKDRMPVILTKIIDTICQKKNEIVHAYGQDAANDIKDIIRFIGQLKNEIVTNKTLKPMRLNTKAINNDAEEWNTYLENKTHTEGETPTWFNTTWLYCETYMYRVLAQEIGLTSSMQSYDPFEYIKQAAFINSIDSMNILASYVSDIVCNKEYNEESSKNDFSKLLKLSLWGNRYDLSASAGSLQKHTDNPLNIIDFLDENILINNWELAWNIVKKKTDESLDNIHIVLDNAGYELFSDLCLAAFFITIAPATKIIFHVKAYPWYVSDTTIQDFHWTLDHLNSLDHYPNMKLLGKMFRNLLDREIWCIKKEPYWTGPNDFRQMKEKDKKLYALFSNSKLIIFKGDLNYRKLLSDINFEYNISFATALGDFRPTNILSLRTIKSDICVGLSQGMAESLFEKDKNWMITGEYGLIQIASLEVPEES
ncbi:protein-glutamate O-methyltransferase-like isoform X1 [Formica exsecta]|uniref:protein-glutamate O-methyltransferase-like isoform X1 n=2 Tax=Formica exsecta TaxID=72781 RepID=UPI0011437C00|nr:protein-glutamate O-methyltransferase-like isoform X1 [Formica exsecta]